MPSWSAFSVGSLVSLSPGLGAHDEQRSLRALIYDDDAILIKIFDTYHTDRGLLGQHVMCSSLG